MDDSNTWISASDTLNQLEAPLGGRPAVKALLADLLRDGQITARADRAFVSTMIDINKAWSNRHLDGATFDDDVELSSTDWRDSVQWADDVDLWRWPESRFVLTLKRKPIERHFLEGVDFSAADVARLAAGQANPKKEPGPGGRRPDLDRWEWFWMEVIEFAIADRLVAGKFRSQDALARELLEEMSNREPKLAPFGSKTVREQVGRIFNRFCRP